MHMLSGDMRLLQKNVCELHIAFESGIYEWWVFTHICYGTHVFVCHNYEGMVNVSGKMSFRAILTQCQPFQCLRECIQFQWNTTAPTTTITWASSVKSMPLQFPFEFLRPTAAHILYTVKCLIHKWMTCGWWIQGGKVPWKKNTSIVKLKNATEAWGKIHRKR